MNDDYLREMTQQAEAAVRRMEAPRDAFTGIVGSATSDDGLITVKMAADGAVQSVKLEPKAMRLPSEDLALAFADTVNAARANLREQLASQGGDPTREFQEFAEKLTGKNGSFTNALAEMQRELKAKMERAQMDLERLRPDPTTRRPR